MSSIQKMSIQGIRSFGSEDANRQVIQFDPPLTLILGPNGSGKTTIIECLRYMTTGEMPPNCRDGCFVHDPKVAHETTVKGQIKLQLKDMTNKIMVITRSLEATQRVKNVSLRTLDGSIKRKDASGESATLSSKCAEINREMISSLGVSKAVLNNVIFCHQEESNWPLSEGKALKEKFDEIFAATRYIKALKSIKDVRAEQMKNKQTYQAEIKYLKENKEEANKLKKELENAEIRLLASKNKIKEISEKLQPIKQNLETIIRREASINEIKEEKAKHEGRKKEILKRQNELKHNIKIIFQGSKQQLQLQINDFETKLQEKKNLLKKLKQDSSNASRECDIWRNEQSTLMKKLGTLNAEHKQYLETILKRDEKLIKFCGDLKVFIDITPNKNLPEFEVDSALQQISLKIKDEQDQLQSIKVKHEKLENDIQNQLDNFRDKKTELEHSCKIDSKQIDNNKKEISSITMELSHVSTLANKKDDLEHDIKELDNKLKEMESGNIENFRKKIDEKKSEKNNYEVQLNKLNAEMNKLQKEHKIRAEVDLLTKDKKRKEDIINKIKIEHSETIIHLLGTLPNEKIHQHIEKYISNLTSDIQNRNGVIEKKKLNLSSLETTRKYLSEQLMKKEQDLELHKNKIIQICGSEDFDKSFEILQKKIKELHDEKGALIGSQYIFTTYIEKLKHRSPCCPLCHRGFEEQQQALELINDLERKMKMVPSQLERKETAIGENQLKLNAMTELRPLREEIKNLSMNIIPELREKLSNCSTKIESEKAEIEELEEILESKTFDRQTAISLQQNAVIWDQNYSEVKRLEDRLLNLTCHLGGADINRTVQQVSDEQEMVNLKLTAIKNEIEHYQQKITEHTENIQSLRSKRNDFQSDLLQISSRLQQRSSLEEQKKKLVSENLVLDEKLKEAKSKLKDLENKLKDLRKEKELIVKEKEKDLEMQRVNINKMERTLQDIKNLSKQISSYINEKKEEMLNFQQDNLNDLIKELKNKEKILNELTVKISSLNEELTTHQLKERELHDNMNLIECEQQIKETERKLLELDEQLGSSEIISLMAKKDKIMKEKDKLLAEQHSAQGRENELKENTSQLMKKLETGIYKNADKRYTDKLIELRTTELACEDLSKYYKALDCAIMRYHAMKMNEINKIIRELWMKTYAGNDIDYIEIRSDEEQGNFGLERKRMYHYKVVMVKGDIAIDMRGRCSAGQKVLASLIIRLALAETFCLNCGILALDEPTTNLDRDNIEHLAQALAEIVQSRSSQRNFQLIIITHDEEFIELLGRSDAVEYYYRVSRDMSGFSKIAKCSI